MAEEEMQKQTNTTSTKNGGVTKKEPKKGGQMTKILVLAVIILLALFMWTERKRQATEENLHELQARIEELQASTEDSSQEEANEVRVRVAELMEIPSEPVPTVARINNIERLRESNTFFDAAENGDFLVLTSNRAILYDKERGIIIDVAPFQVQESSPSPSSTTQQTTQSSATENSSEE